ncbi:hypothetical protein BH24ACT7_BH24ACT7_23920 [soil metagenome]
MDQDPLHGVAALAGIAERASDERGGGMVEVRIGVDDIRRVATELEEQPLQPSSPCNRDSRGGPAGERDSADAGIADHRGPHAWPACDHLDGGCRESRLDEDFDDAVTAEWGLWGRLEDHRVAHDERGSQLVDRQVHRRIERRYRGYHTDLLGHDEGENPLATGQSIGPRDRAIHSLCRGGGGAERSGAALRLSPRVAHGLAGLAGGEGGETAHLLQDERGS